MLASSPRSRILPMHSHSGVITASHNESTAAFQPMYSYVSFSLTTLSPFAFTCGGASEASGYLNGGYEEEGVASHLEYTGCSLKAAQALLVQSPMKRASTRVRGRGLPPGGIGCPKSSPSGPSCNQVRVRAVGNLRCCPWLHRCHLQAMFMDIYRNYVLIIYLQALVAQCACFGYSQTLQSQTLHPALHGLWSGSRSWHPQL